MHQHDFDDFIVYCPDRKLVSKKMTRTELLEKLDKLSKETDKQYIRLLNEHSHE